MKKTWGKIKRTISVLLAAAMIITALPQASVSVHASEAQDVLDGGSGADSAQDTAQQDAAVENDSAGAADSAQQDGTGSGDQGDSQETEEEDSAVKPDTGDETETEQPDAGDGTDASEAQGGEATDADEAPDGDGADADETDIDGTFAGDEESDTDAEELQTEDDAEAAKVRTLAGEEEGSDGSEVKKINVNISLPYYKESYDWIPSLAEFVYAAGEDTDFTSVDMAAGEPNWQGKYTVSIPVEVDKSLRFKLSCADHMRLKNVTVKSKYGRNDYSNSEVIEAADGVYTIEVKEQDEYSWAMIESYEIDINVLQIWNITFVDLYARSHDGAASVEIYQKSQSGEGGTEEPVNIAGQTITVDSEEWDNYYYKVQPKENFTFDSMAASVSGITVKQAEIRDETNAYRLIKNANVPKDITVFVTAEESKDKTLTLNMPSEVTNAMQIEVYGKDPSQTEYTKLELTDGQVTVRDDVRIYIKVTSDNMAYMVQATLQEAGGEPEPFAKDDVDTEMGEGSWRRDYTLGTLNYVKDGITVNLSRVGMKKVSMNVDWAAVSEIRVSTPVSLYLDNSEGDGSEARTIYVPEGEALKFRVDMRDGKGTACVSAEDGQEIGVAGYDSEPYYSIVPDSAMNIYVKGKAYEYRFQYSEDDASILVYETENGNEEPGGEPVELTDNCYRSNRKNAYLWVMVKPEANKEFSVWYDNGNGDRQDVGRKSWYDKTEEDGSKYFCYGPIDEYWMAGNTITIEGYNTNTVTFQTEHNLYFYKMTYDSTDDYFMEEDRIEDSVTVREGEDLYFRVGGYNSDTHRLAISMTGTDRDSLESIGDAYEGHTVYHLVPAADTTIKVAVEERKQCQVVVEKSGNVKSFYADYDGDEEGEGITSAGTYVVREEGYVIFTEITAEGSAAEAAAKKAKITYRIGEESYEASPEYDLDSGESDPWYRIKVTDNMTISVDVQDTTQYTLSFKDAAQLENIHVWKLGTYKEKDNLYRADADAVTLDDKGYYYFDFQLKDGVGLSSVTLKDSAGSEKILTRTCLYEDGEMGYRLGMVQGNTEIFPELVPGYTVKFDLSKLSAEEKAAVNIYASLLDQEDVIVYEGIDSRKLSSAATESSWFYLAGWEHYKLIPDSELFTITKSLAPEAANENEYVYVVSPKQTTGLPEVVTISLEKYAEHTVTLDYSDEIRSIRLEDIYGNKFAFADNETKIYKVYGEGAVLRVKAIDGYSPVVKVKGSAEEAVELAPYRTDDTGASEYYLDEIEEDKTIQVTVVRSAQRKTYYKVGFLNEGGNVTVRDTVYDTLYTVSNDQEYYRADYSVLKGDKISFYVEPAKGYELEGVYVNGQKIQPVRDTASQRDIYEVTPVADTQIRIDASWIVPKYPLIFRWSNTDAVKSVKVQGYELQNNRIDVAGGTKISFSVELTDTKYSVTSVTMNGQEVPYSAGSGYYTLTTLYEPMNVEINAGVADKIVRFTNTLENAQYEVETNELIRHRNEDTYLASGNAELLKFTVNVPDKTMKVGVTYLNQQGVKSVLRAKTQTDMGEQGLSYSYEIAVDQLPLNSEITISGALPEGDKKELEAAVAKYEKYQKSEYTEDSWTAFETALKAAQDCMKKEDATQEEIDAALGALNKAAAGLVKKGDTPDPGPDVPDGLWFEILGNPATKDGSYTYTGAAVKPEIKVYHGKELLQAKKDYTVAYKNNTNAGTATITVTGKGNFKGNAAATFEIKQKDIGDEDIIAPDSICAVINSKGGVGNPKVAVKFGKKTLKANNDYKVVWPSDTELKDAQGKAKAGEYEVTISTTAVKTKNGAPSDSVNYTGERKIKYTVCASDIKLMGSAKITLDKTKVDYAGELGADTDKPLVTSVKIGKTTLEADDYTVSYDENWNKVGKATVTVTAKEGSKYFGSKSVTYTVNGTKLAAKELKIEGINANGYDYTGKPISINAEAEDPAMRTLKVTRIKANGKPIEGGGTLLEEGKDYTVSYKTGKKTGEHTNAGTVTVTITGINAYTGSVNRTFKIKPIDLAAYGTENPPAGLKITAQETAKYSKAGAKPAITELTFNGEPLVEKRDYTVSYTKNTTVRKGEKSAAMTIKGKGNFKGSYKHTYEVTIASETDVYATAADIVKPAKFTQVKPAVKVYEASTGKALKAGTDYDKTITYYSDADCTKPITADNFNKPVAEGSTETPTDVDKEIYAKINMKGNYAGTTGTPGTVTAKFRVYNKDLKMTSKKLVVTVDTTKDKGGKDIGHDGTKNKNPYYTGAVIEPKVTVTLKGSGGAAGQPLTEGVDYRVEYTNNKNKGKATVTVIGIGNGYGGSKSLKFTIVPKNMDWAEQAAKAAQKALEVFTTIYE